MATVEIWGDGLEFATEAKEWVAAIYKKWHGPNAVVLFRRTPVQLQIDEQLFIIKEEDNGATGGS